MDKRKEFVEQLKKKIIFKAKEDEQFYVYMYLSLVEEYADDYPAPMGATFKETLPAIVYGDVQGIMDMTRGRLDDAKVFFEVIKHELLHLINLHPIRVASYLKRRRIPPTDENIFILNVIADSIVNRYILREVVDAIGGIPPDESNKTLEELADEVFRNQNDKFGEGNAGGSAGANEKMKSGKERRGKKKNNKHFGLPDLDRQLIRELVSHPDPNVIKEFEENIKENIKNLVERIKTVGNLPGVVEEIIKSWKPAEFYVIEDENILFAAMNNVERLFNDVSPIAVPPVVLPVYRPYGGNVVLVVIDTSGSMDNEALEYGFYVLKRLARSKKVYVLQVDTEVKGKAVGINKWSFPAELKVEGRGGTDFACLEKIKSYLPHDAIENVTTVVIFTDGMVDKFPSYNPLPNAKWIGITTYEIPKDSPNWIMWTRIQKTTK